MSEIHLQLDLSKSTRLASVFRDVLKEAGIIAPIKYIISENTNLQIGYFTITQEDYPKVVQVVNMIGEHLEKIDHPDSIDYENRKIISNIKTTLSKLSYLCQLRSN